MRLTTVAAIGFLLLGGRGPASATRGRRVSPRMAVHHEETALRHAGDGALRGRRARHKGDSERDTQTVGGAEQGGGAAAEGQSATIVDNRHRRWRICFGTAPNYWPRTVCACADIHNSPHHR